MWLETARAQREQFSKVLTWADFAREAWEAAYKVAFQVMALPRRHALSRYVIHVHPTVRRASQESRNWCFKKTP